MKRASLARKGVIAQNSAISALARAPLSRVWEGCVANKRVSAHPSLRLGARKSAICAPAERRGRQTEDLEGGKEAERQGRTERLRWEEGACRGWRLSITSRLIIAWNS